MQPVFNLSTSQSSTFAFKLIKLLGTLTNLLISTILLKIYETNFSVSVKWHTMWKVQFQFLNSFSVRWHTKWKVQFQFLNSFLLVLTKFLFWEEDWALGYNSGLSMIILHMGDKSPMQEHFFKNSAGNLLSTLRFLGGLYNFCNFVIMLSLM